MRKAKEYPKEYLYQGQVNYLKIAKETNWLTEKKLEKFTKKTKETARKKAANEIVKIPKKLDRRQHFIDTYGDLETALNLLDRREREVITYLNGLDGNKPLSQKEVGEKMHFTSAWVSNINRKALKKLDYLKKN